MTTGTQEPFDRLLRMADNCPCLPANEIVCQSIKGLYNPVNFSCRSEFSQAEFDRQLQEARFIISHAGVGTILSALEAGKQLVLVPRLSAMGEHRTDHQIHTVEKLRHLPNVHVATEAAEFEAIINRLLIHTPATTSREVKSVSLTKYVEHFIAT